MAVSSESLKFLSNSLNISSGIMSAGAAISGGISQSSYYRYLSKKAIAENNINTMLAGITAGIEQKQKASAIAGIKRNLRGTIGAQAAAFAANNIDSSSQTVQDEAIDSAKAADRDVKAIEYNANLSIFQRTLQLALDKENAKASASMYETAAKNATINSYISSGISLFQSGGYVARSWYDRYGIS